MNLKVCWRCILIFMHLLFHSENFIIHTRPWWIENRKWISTRSISMKAVSRTFRELRKNTVTICKANTQTDIIWDQTSTNFHWITGQLIKKMVWDYLTFTLKQKCVFRNTLNPLHNFYNRLGYYVSLAFSNQVLLGPKNVMIEFLVDAKSWLLF